MKNNKTHAHRRDPWVAIAKDIDQGAKHFWSNRGVDIESHWKGKGKRMPPMQFDDTNTDDE